MAIQRPEFNACLLSSQSIKNKGCLAIGNSFIHQDTLKVSSVNDGKIAPLSESSSDLFKYFAENHFGQDK